MSQGTSIEELYTSLGAVLLSATGRVWWKGYGMKISPNKPHAIIILSEGRGMQSPIVENVVLDPPVDEKELQQIPWGTSLFDCTIKFLKSSDNNSALQAATRFKNSLRLEARAFDLNEIMGISGNVSLLDISSIFRADVEPRVDIKFKFYANISLPYTLVDSNISEIETQEINISHINNNLDSTEIMVEVNKP